MILKIRFKKQKENFYDAVIENHGTNAIIKYKIV